MAKNKTTKTIGILGVVAIALSYYVVHKLIIKKREQDAVVFRYQLDDDDTDFAGC